MTMRRTAGVALLAMLLAGPAAAQDERADGESEPETVEVRMIDKGPTLFVFEPAEITVRLGDRVVWIQEGIMPHNVEFTVAPDGGDAGSLPTSPFLTAKGQRFELVIDERFIKGEYEYVCTPHVAMGMRGTLKVVPTPSR